MKNVSNQVPYAICCGCGACANTCSKGAIRMVENREGFLVPQVDEALCVDCGLCLKACPALQDKRENDHKPDCYASQAPDNIRAISSSGGVFTPLAEAILNRGGFVCGAAFRNDWTVHHIIIDKKEDLDKLRRSKYVQSDTEDCFKRIKALLRDGKWVLFSGTPCQVAGLYTYLGKEYDTLLTVDIFCHGAPSPGVWKRYLKENYKPGTIADVNFRDKKAIGWSCSHVAITLKNGEKEVSDNYTKWFHSSVILRPSCEDCKYSKIPRPADISLGDWWSISKIDTKLNDGKGLSNVLLNSEKGKNIYASLNLSKSQRIALPDWYNNGHLRHGIKLNRERANFFRDNMPLNTDKRTKESTLNQFDLCYVSIYYGRNYGSILVSYAGYKILQSLGFSVLALNKPKCVWERPIEEVDDVIQLAFAWRHYDHISPMYPDLVSLGKLNEFCNGFVVGSDQIFSPHLHLDTIAYLQYARTDKVKIAFGTSFGHESYLSNSDRIYKNKALLQRFDHIALREIPKNIVENIFELNASQIIDPTLILPKEEFHKLANASNLNTGEPYLLTYCLDMNSKKENAIAYIAKQLNLRIVYIRNLQHMDRRYEPSLFHSERDYTPEDFCKLYQNASFVVTDSYHGSCFSIIFRRNFVSIINTERGKIRYEMFNDFGLLHRFYSSPEEVYNTKDWMEDIDFSQAENIIAEKADFAREWLSNSLSSLRKQEPSHIEQTACEDYPKKQGLRKALSKRIAYPVRDFFRSLRKMIIGK